jgi:hypothetical protein
MHEGNSFVVSPRLCCSTFFYYLWDVSDKSSKQQGNVLTNATIKSLGAEGTAADIMMDICGLLNSGGGVMLFDTVRDSLQIMPKGDTLISKQTYYIQKI